MSMLITFSLSLLIANFAEATIFAYPPLHSNRTLRMFNDVEADFGKMPTEGVSGVLDITRPANACIPVVPLHKRRIHSNHVIALVQETRGCLYSSQVENAQIAGYKAVIIYRRKNDGVLITMNGDGPYIPAVYTRRAAGEELKTFLYDTDSIVKIVPNQRLPLQLYLIPFAVVVGVCFFFMIAFSLGRYLRYWLHKRRSRLSPANLKKIPTKKFKKGDLYDVCAICIEEYEENENIRILPCQHAYHCSCVDPWLTSGKKLCPVCNQPVETAKKKKQKVQSLLQASTSNTDGEETADENTPLLSSGSHEQHGAIA